MIEYCKRKTKSDTILNKNEEVMTIDTENIYRNKSHIDFISHTSPLFLSYIYFIFFHSKFYIYLFKKSSVCNLHFLHVYIIYVCKNIYPITIL